MAAAKSRGRLIARFGGQADRYEREPGRADVGEHVRRVREQRQRANDRPEDHTPGSIKPTISPERERELPAIGVSLHLV